jgi:hypothetical protein
MPRKKSSIKKPNIPPTNLQGIETYYRNLGYRPNPTLEDRGDADVTFVKPLPDGRRKHVRVKKGTKYFTHETHIDKTDPGRNPVGHILNDVLLDEPRHEKFRTPVKKKQKTRRAKKSR